jgi:hypothetical protein
MRFGLGYAAAAHDDSAHPAALDPERLNVLWNRLAAVRAEFAALDREFREAAGIALGRDGTLGNAWVIVFREYLLRAVVRLGLRRAGLDGLDENELVEEVLKLMDPAGFDAAAAVRAVENHKATYEAELFALLVSGVASELRPRRRERGGATVRFSEAPNDGSDFQLALWRMRATTAKALRGLSGGRKKREPEGVPEHLLPGLESLGRLLDVLGGARPSQAKDILDLPRAGTAHARARGTCRALSGGRTLRWFRDGRLELTFASEGEAKAVWRLLWADRRMRAAGYTTARRGSVLLRGPAAIEAEMAALALAPAIRPIASTPPGR